MNEAVLRAFLAMTPRPCDAEMKQEPFLSGIAWQISNHPAFALPDLIQPTAIVGFVHALGVGEAWMVTGEGFERSAPVVARQARQLCFTVCETLNLHRLHMRIDSDRADSKLWAEKTGFVFEARLKRMGAQGQDEDVYLWEATKGDG